MKILLILILIFAGFVLGANAQLCGQYTTTLTVKTEDNKSVENSVVQLVALGKDETKSKTFVRNETDRSRFSVTFYEGHVLLGKYKMIVSADGFETAEREIGFPHCKNQDFEFRLIKKNFERKMLLTGAVFDTNGAVIIEAKITAYRNNGKKYESKTNDEGIYTISLPFDVYKIEVYSPGFCTSISEKYRIVDSTYGKMSLDFVLDVASSNSCTPIDEKQKKKNTSKKVTEIIL